MKAKRRRHEPEFKARVALEALKGIKPIHQIAKDSAGWWTTPTEDRWGPWDFEPRVDAEPYAGRMVGGTPTLLDHRWPVADGCFVRRGVGGTAGLKVADVCRKHGIRG